MITPLPPDTTGKVHQVEPQQFQDGQEANCLYAVISIKPDGTEGMCSIQDDDGQVFPLITERFDRVLHLRPHAQRMAKSPEAIAGKVRFVLRKFSDATDIEEF